MVMMMTRWRLEVAVEEKIEPSANRDPVSSSNPAAGINIINIIVIALMKEMMTIFIIFISFFNFYLISF